MKKKSRMRKIYESRIFWAVISLLASLAIWIYVTGVEQEEFKQTFRGVKVELIGEDVLRTSRDLVITDLDVSTVTIDVVGPRRVVGSLDADDLTAQIDVSKFTQSAYTSQQYNVQFPDGTDTRSISITRKTPETVNFMVSQQTNKTIPVRGSFDGKLADDYTAETPVFEPSTITVTGPESYIKDISYAWVSFGEDGIESTYTVETGYTIMDSAGEPCSTAGLSFSADTVLATLPILQIKEVSLDVNLIEGAGANAENTVVTIEPQSLSLVGDSAILSGMNKIVLSTIDLTDFTSTFTETYTIPLSNDVKSLTGITEAKVTVEIVGLETRNFKITNNFSCINVTDGYYAQVLTESLDVVLRGTPEQLEAVKSENIRAVADLTDYDESSGSFMPTVKIYVDGATDVGAIGDYPISIEIRKVQQ